jgi:hypothetical protein
VAAFNGGNRPGTAMGARGNVAMIVRLAAVLALLVPLTLLASPSPAADEPKAYSCNFVNGVTHSYDKGTFAEEKASPLAFGIAAIDIKAQSAELKTGGGTGQLRIVRAVNATHFLEVVTEGFLHITTIYDKDEVKGAYPAVHSRHFGLFGQPLVTQYQGFCEPAG